MKIDLDAQVAIRSFTQSLIAGDLGPDDSRDGRSLLFLKNPGIVGQAMAIFFIVLKLTRRAEFSITTMRKQRVRQFIKRELYPDELPEPPFNEEEFGIL